jgi:hypothetical protein
MNHAWKGTVVKVTNTVNDLSLYWLYRAVKICRIIHYCYEYTQETLTNENNSCTNFEIISRHTVNPALLASSFVWHIQLYFLHISLFKIINRKYLIQSKCELMKFLFVLLEKIKILPLYTVYLPHQLLHMLFITPFRNF